MPDWNGLGYQSLATQATMANADRLQNTWQKLLGVWADRLNALQAQKYETGAMGLQNKYATGFQELTGRQASERQAAGDAAAAQREEMGNRSALERLMLELKSRLTPEQQMQMEREKIGAAKTPKEEPPDMWTYLTKASGITGIGVGMNGLFGGFTSIADDASGTRADKISRLRSAFWRETERDPNKAALRSYFDEQAGMPGGGVGAGQPNAAKITPQQQEMIDSYLAQNGKFFPSLSDEKKLGAMLYRRNFSQAMIDAAIAKWKQSLGSPKPTGQGFLGGGKT